jgi:hypothetical protein
MASLGIEMDASMHIHNRLFIFCFHSLFVICPESAAIHDHCRNSGRNLPGALGVANQALTLTPPIAPGKSPANIRSTGRTFSR